MRSGTGEAITFDQAAPALVAPAQAPLVFEHATVLQVAFEYRRSGTDALFPAALHPVSPPVATWVFLHVPETDFGPVTLAEVRVLCRSGIRARALVVDAWTDNGALAAHLADGWGLRAHVADVRLARHYDGTRAKIAVDGNTLAQAGMRHPVDLGAVDLQLAATVHAVRLERGTRLVHVERDWHYDGTERGTPYLDLRRPIAAIEPSNPVSASVGLGRLTIQPPTVVGRLDASAFEGTEPIAG